jgi:hypothetical protein
MDPNFDFGGGRGFHACPQGSFSNANTVELFFQQQISQQEARSPSHRDAYSPSCSDSPTPPTTTHQQTTSQPYVAAYYPTSPTGLPQSTSSPVSPQFALTSDPNYAFNMNNYSALSAHGGGMGESNHSIE